MKSLKRILKQEPLYLGEWSSKEEVEMDLEARLDNDNVLFASLFFMEATGMFIKGYCHFYLLVEKDGSLFYCSDSAADRKWLKNGSFNFFGTDLDLLENDLLNNDLGNENGHFFGTPLKRFLGVEVVPKGLD